MKKYSISDLQSKFKELLEKEGSLLCTEDGQAFYNNEQGKNHARNHAATAKVKVLEISADENNGNLDFWELPADKMATIKGVNKDDLIVKAIELGIEEPTGTKLEISELIAAKVEEAQEAQK